MNIFNSYKRSRFFLWVNITGLAIGLAASILLILFVVNELSYDKHFANSNRIVRLINKMEMEGKELYYPICLRKAYTELPGKVAGIEAATQIYPNGPSELIYETQRFQGIKTLPVDSGFFRIFQMKFIEGTPLKPFETKNSIVITRKYAGIIFGNPNNAIGKTVSMSGQAYTVSAVVEELPTNTHFTFDVLQNIEIINPEDFGGLEFFTYFLINPVASVSDVSASLEKEYTKILTPFAAQFNGKGHAIVEKLTDIHLHSKALFSLGSSTDMKFIWLLTTIALVILVLAIVNFVNLFMAQCETRMNEIGIRKTNGASITDIVRQFFSETAVLVLLAFVLGFFLAAIATPHFSKIIHKNIDLIQLLNPAFILCVIGLFAITVTLSAGYPAFYMSRFSPLDILGKRLKFSKRRLTSILIILQSVITIVLISYILIVNRQITYLKDLPLNYNPKNIMMFPSNEALAKSYDAIRQELLTTPGIQKVSGAQHAFGGGTSGEGIALPDDRENQKIINTYRIKSGLCELMGLQLVEGEFYNENTPDSVRQIILNEAAVKMLGLKSPVVGKEVEYYGTREIIGVVKDFIYNMPNDPVAPLVLQKNNYPVFIYVKFDDNLGRIDAQKLVLNTLHKFDSEFVLNPTWSEDIYTGKFDDLNLQFKVLMIGCALSVFIAMIGLLAIHLYTAKRRTKEIAIRRINGAEGQTIFTLLSMNIIQWILIAGIIAIPVAYYVTSNWLNNYTNHVGLGWIVFVVPILIQCVIALLTTSGVSLNVLSQNPVKSLKSE
jgi:putative ABC transport system permease protein